MSDSSKNRKVSVRFTPEELRRIEERRGDKTASDYIRELVTRDSKEGAEEGRRWKDFEKKLFTLDMEGFSRKLGELIDSTNSRTTKIEEVIRVLIRHVQDTEGEPGQAGDAGQADLSNFISSRFEILQNSINALKITVGNIYSDTTMIKNAGIKKN